jgi:hypothetical protein
MLSAGIRGILALGVVTLFALGFVIISLSDMRASDDNIWLYGSGVAHFQNHREAVDLEDFLTGRVRDLGASDADAVRYGMRADYRSNYLLPLLGWGAVAKAVDAGSRADLVDYARAVGAAIVASAAAVHGLAVLALAIGVFATGRIDLSAALFGGIAVLLVLTMVVPGGAAMLFWEREGAPAFINALWFSVHPDAQFSIFGFTPRSQLAVAVLLAFVMRWRGWIGAAYALVALSGLVHQSMATLAFAVVFAMDLVIRPTVLIRRDVLPFLVIALVLIATRETLWTYVLVPAALVRFFILIAVLATAALGIMTLRRAGRLGRLSLWSRRVAALPLYQVDAVLLGGGWLVTLPVGYFLAQYADPLHRLYFWDQVHTRSLMLIEPAIGCAIVLAVWHRLTLRPSRIETPHPLAAVGAVAVVVLLFAWASQPITTARTEVDRLSNAMAALGARLDRPLGHVPGIDDEALLYLGLARQRDTGERVIERLLPLSGD